ncbi:MAG: hypothetical protein CV045_08455 [Cyanobacteria bacterium M5B4]|nr:MAG: hypothetical protein CV045_08455 [Cyanobacteria bacterium M5B4]
MINALDVKSNSNIFNLAIQTNKKVANFSPQRFSSSNCIITNLITIDDFNYRALVRVLNSGIVTISIPAENLVSVTGLRNQESNIYSNTFILPSIVPDPYWDNVIFYLLGDSLNDQSQYNLTVDTTNVSLDYDITPPGLSSSLRFNGTTSRINVNLGQTLSAVIDYTIELFIYCRGDISFTLNPPILNPPNAVRSRSFQLTWSPVDNATSYRLFVSPSPTFSVETKMFTTQNNEIQIGSEKGSIEIEKEYLSSSKEIGFKVKKNPSLLGEFFISQDSNFNSYRTILSKDFWIGGQKGVLKGVEEVEAVTPSLVEPKYILQGIIGNIQTPFLFFLPQENTLRYYNKLDYSLPAYYEEVEISKWFYIALVNNSAKRRMELYVNGEFVDKSQASNFNQFLSIGFSLGGFNGNLAGIRITKGVKRSINEETYLPYGVQI